MVEAMACGTPVLAMPVGSVPEVVRDGVSGYICRTVRDMVRHIQTLDINPQMVRQYVEENFSIERMVRSYLTLYEDVLGTAGSRQVA